MATSIKLKKSSISGRIPSTSDLDFGELAINYADGILYFKNSSNQVSSVNARALGVDSTATFSIIDSAYINAIVANTTGIAEGTNLYYTSARADSDAKNAISVTDAGGDGSLSYNATTGVLTYTGPSASEVRTHITANKGVSITSGEINIDSANVKGMFSASGDLTYNSSTGQFNIDVESVYTADNFDSDYILAKDSANTSVERNKHDATTKNFSVTVASKTTDHVYNGSGSPQGYVIDGTQSPIVQLQIGRTYRFTLSSGDMSSHPFRFYYDAARTTQYTTNVTTTSAYAEIEITESTPAVLHYQCTYHSYMGHAFVIGTRNLTGFSTDNLSEGSNNLYYTNTRVETLVDSSYIQSRQITNPTGVDSSATINLIDSSYVQSIQTKYTNNDFADSAFVTSQINTLIDAAPGTLDTLNELAAALGDDANFSNTVTSSIATKLPLAGGTMSGDIDGNGNKVLFANVYSQVSDLPNASTYHGMFAHVHSTGAGYFAHAGNWIKLANDTDKLDSAQAIAIIDSSYVQARQINNPTGLDSALASQLINSSYIQARQIKYTNNDFTDSAFVTSQINLIDSSYVQARQITNPTGVDSSATINLIDSSYVQARQITNPTGVDSSATINLVDSSYVQARQITNPTGVDSSATINLIDSSHIQNRQIKYTNNDFADSAFVTTQINNLIDAAPGALDTLNELAAAIGDDVNFSTTITNQIAAKLDSAQAIAIIDSAYVQARVTASSSGNDSATTIALIDSAYVNAFTIDANTLNGQNASYYLDYGNLNNVPSEFTDSSTVDSIILNIVDSAYVQARSDNIVDSAYVQARFGTLRESNNSLILSGSIIPETDSAFSLGTAEKKFKDLHLSGGTVFLDNLALSADPVNQRINIGRLDSNNIVNVIGVIATVDSAGVSAIVDSAFLEARLGDFVSETELTSKNFTTFDSANATSVIDSSYINSLNADAGALNGQNGAFYSDYRNLTNKPEGGIDYGTVVASATSAIDILDILIAQTTVDYGTVGSPGGLISNYGTL
jgi:hypothetical protein